MEVTDHQNHLKSVTEQAQGLVSEINHDIDIDCFNNYYDTYRKIRMHDWHSFVAENKSTLDHWWSKALEENLV